MHLYLDACSLAVSVPVRQLFAQVLAPCFCPTRCHIMRRLANTAAGGAPSTLWLTLRCCHSLFLSAYSDPAYFCILPLLKCLLQQFALVPVPYTVYLYF